MSDDGGRRVRRGASQDDEMTRIDTPRGRKRPPEPSVPDAEPTRPMTEDPVTADTGMTQRIRPEDVNRRALPFKRTDDRRNRDSAPSAEAPVVDVQEVDASGELAFLLETGTMRQPSEPPLPFATPHAAPVEMQPMPAPMAAPVSDPYAGHYVPPPEPSTLPRGAPGPDFAQSVWMREAVINAADLPSALAPHSSAMNSAPPPKAKGMDPITLITIVGVALVLLMCALALLL